jgi:aryl-alcohol dehydrogenase-like predicted oxidoreductase
MIYRDLGKTGISVSRLCFGGLTIGPSQANLTVDAGAEIVSHAISKGINFIDTAELYGTYGHIREGIKKSGKFDTVVATKCYAYNRELAEKSFNSARKSLDRDVIDIFLLHEQESIHTLNGHKGAFEFFSEQKAKGNIRAVGLSTHFIAGVKGGMEFGDIDIIHTIFNCAGWGIADGGADEDRLTPVEDGGAAERKKGRKDVSILSLKQYQMEKAVMAAASAGIGVYGMKALGGGNLIEKAENALKYVLEKDYIASVAVGMQSFTEIDANVNFFETGEFGARNKEKLRKINRRLHIEDWCTACGKCVKRCKNGALFFDAGGKLRVSREKCVLCSYCSRVCENMCLKVL